jgi:hypothetical protein
MSKNLYVQTRREFIKQGAVGAAGLAFWPLPGGGAARQESAVHHPGSENVIYRTLGRTGIKIPILSFGAPRDPLLIHRAIEAGVMYFDTAYRYGGGSSERLIGEALKGRPRESYIAATKIMGYRDNRTGLVPAGVAPADYKAGFRKNVESSLRRLNVEYLDILYLHGVENLGLLATPFIKEIMLELRDEGKVRSLGVSFHHKELELIPAAIKEKIYDVILTSHNFRQPHRLEVRGAIAAAARAGLGIIAMKTTAGAYWDRERKHPINVKAALKWLFQDENVHSTIPGAQTVEEVDLDLAAMADPVLTPQEEEDLRYGEQNKLAGLYCAQCGACQSQCRNSLPIPTIMRSYMYAYGYQDIRLAKDVLRGLEEDEIRCRSCAPCAVSCTMGFDVPERIRDVTRLLAAAQKLSV